MKNRYNNYLLLVLLSFLTLVVVSCGDDFFDINEDPNNPTEAQLSQLMTNSQVAVAGAVGLSTGGLSSVLGTYTHQFTRRDGSDRYAIQGNDFMITTSWQHFYDIAMQDLRVIIDEGTAEGNMIYVGIAKLLKAYSFSVIVDVWGDVPFSEASLFPEITFPKFDDDAEIYPALLTLIDEGIADLNNADASNNLTPGSDDLIYGGSVSSWQRFAKTLKLKLLNQVRMVNVIPGAVSQINQILTEGDIIGSQSDDFELWYGTSATPENRHPGFVVAYTQGQPIFYISIWFHQIMSGQNPDILTNVTDPRIPYYYTDQLLPGEAPQNPPEYLESDGFLSIHFGSSHPNQAGNQNVSSTAIGVYPCGGWYDDGSGQTVNASAGTGVAPERMLTNYARLFIEAELALDGVTSGDARQLLIDAIQASFDKVNQVVGRTGSSQSIPSLSQDTIDYYTNMVLADYDAGDQDRKLEIILTQKWIASYGYNVDSYSDYRRRGFPILFDPNNDVGPFAQFTSSNEFMVSLPWRSEDLNLNPNAPPQKNPYTDKVFWDPN